MTHEEQRKRRKAIAEWVRANKATAIAAAREFHVSRPTVYAACDAHNVDIAADRYEARRKRRKAIAEFVSMNNATLHEAASEHKVCLETARDACHEHHVVPRQRDRVIRSNRVFEIIAALLNSDRLQREIAFDAHVTIPYVSHIKVTAEAAGVRFPKRKGTK